MRNGNIAGAFFRRHARLLALCGLSLVLHAIVIAWLGTRVRPPLPFIGQPPLALRLAGAPPAAPAPSAPSATPAPLAAGSPATPALPLPARGAAAPAPAKPAPMPAAPPSAAPAGGGVATVEMPSRYRVAVPPSATLRYQVRGTDGGATLAWETDGVNYRLTLDGILGEVQSEGGTDDAGLAPARARYRMGSGNAGIAFERERGAIVLETLGRSVQDTPGSQDGASVLMQLAGIGLADPDQLQDMVDIYVGRPDGASVERFQVLGRETIATPLGPMETLHLARAGKAPLEVWLAPAQGWLPVQLRAQAPDGSPRTQVIKDIVRAPAQ